MPKWSSALLACVLLFPIAGCRGGLIPSPSTSEAAAAAAAYDYVPTYTRAPCWMQRKWSEHNSVHASTLKGKPVVWKAPCDAEPEPENAPSGAAKLS